jgi:hypothetical protein
MAPLDEFYYRNYSHWTNIGTFRIEPVTLGGSWHVVLWFNDANLGTYSYPETAAESISDGKHDHILGFEASRLGVPRSPDSWNGFR